MNKFKIFGSNLAIDLGTANTSVYKVGEGIVLREASMVALDVRNGEVVAVGNKAKDMIGKTPEYIVIVKPLENGIISDFDITKILLKHCIDSTLQFFSILQPKVIVTASTNVTDIEIRAIEDACLYSGARDVYIIETPIASAIGAGLDIDKIEGRLIVNFGAGNTEISIVSLNGIVISKSVNFGGDKFDQDIIDYVYEKYSVVIGENTAKNLKETIGTVDEIETNELLGVSGRDVLSGMPVNIDIFSSDIKSALEDNVYEIIDNIKYVLEKTPPELSNDILKHGIFITGGGSLLKGLDNVLRKKINIRVKKSKTPLDDAVNGAGIVITKLNKFISIGK